MPSGARSPNFLASLLFLAFFADFTRIRSLFIWLGLLLLVSKPVAPLCYPN